MHCNTDEHAVTKCVIQRWVDSSISKTVNAPAGYTVEQVEKVYQRLYKGGAKGGTVYVDGSRDTQVLTLKAEENTSDDKQEKSQASQEQHRVMIMDTIKTLACTTHAFGT